MPRVVMALSSRYPQLLCILLRFCAETSVGITVRIMRVMLNDPPTRAIFINSKPRFGLTGGAQSPLSGVDAPCRARSAGIVGEEVSGESLERSLDKRGDGTSRVPVSRC